MALYISIEEHEEGHDYEFAYGEVLDITDAGVDENDDMLEFRINDEEAYCPYGVFDDYFCELDTDGAWFEFADEDDEDAFISNAYTFERMEPADKEMFDTRGLFQLFDIEYIKDGDFLCGIDANNKKVIVPRHLVRFVGY